MDVSTTPANCQVASISAALTSRTLYNAPTSATRGRDVAFVRPHLDRPRCKNTDHFRADAQSLCVGERATRDAQSLLFQRLIKVVHQPLLVGGLAAIVLARRVLTGLRARWGGGRETPPPRPRKAGAATALVWFRNDLRVTDHEPLTTACGSAAAVLPVYIFDPRDYGQAASGKEKMGPERRRFIEESVADLRASLARRGSNLIVRVGRPAEVLPALAAQVGASTVYCQGQMFDEEHQVITPLRSALESCGASLQVLRSGSLFHRDDLTFKPAATPNQYAYFLEKVAKLAVRPPLPIPTIVKPLPSSPIEPGSLPSQADLGSSPEASVSSASTRAHGEATVPRGGETAARQVLRESLLAMKRQQRQPPGGMSFERKIGPWLTFGCLSSRQVFDEVKRHLGPGAVRHPGTHSGGKAETRQRTAAADVSPARGVVWLLLWKDFLSLISTTHTAPTPQATPALAS